MPYPDSLLGSARTWNCWTCPPHEFTSATPGIVRSSGLIVYSCSVFRSMSDSESDCTRYWKTSPIGVAGGPSVGCMPDGNAPAASCMRCVTCARAKYRSTSSSYEMVTTEMPALEIDRTPCVRGNPIIAVSIG